MSAVEDENQIEETDDERPAEDEDAQDYDIALVLGALDDEQRVRIQEQLDAAGARLEEVAAVLAERSGTDNWKTRGVRVEVYESGQSLIKGSVKGTDPDIEFGVELRPSNFFDEARPWRPGEPPRPMNTSAWDVEGEILVMRVAKVSGRKYTIQESAAELEEQRHDSAEAAVAAFTVYVDQMAELALARDPTTEAWQSEVDEYGRPPDEEPPHEFV
jgi:hypothetical protein